MAHQRVLRCAAVVFALLGLVPMANYLSEEGRLPWWRDAVHHWVLWAPPSLLIAFVLARAVPGTVDGVLARGRALLVAPRHWMFALLAGGCATVLSLYFGRAIFEWRAVTGDEFAQGWHASMLTQGHLYARAEELSEFFSTTQSLVMDGRWFPQFPIGGPALMALGSVIGMPWLVNPLLAGIAVAAAYHFYSAVADQVTARSATMLFVLSPFVLFMAGSRMNHVGTLAAVCVALAALTSWSRVSTTRDAHRLAAMIGAAIGVAATIRPFDALVFGACIGVFQVQEAWTHPRLRASLLTQLVVGMIPVGALLAANYATVGAPFSFAYDVLNGPEHRPGFHMTPVGHEHTPRLGLYMVSAYLMKLDIGLMSWPVPAFLPIVATLALQRRATRWDTLLIAIVIGLCAGYGAYWSESYFIGPRFLYVAVPILLLYTARMPAVLVDRFRNATLRRFIALLIPLWLLLTWAIPPGLFGIPRLARFYHVAATPATRILEATQAAKLTNAVVFIPEGWHARLAARMRALGARPLFAELSAAQYDACTLQQALDTAEALPSPVPASARLQLVMQAASRDAPAEGLANLSGGDQVSLVRGRDLPPRCREEMGQLGFFGVNLSELMPYQRLDERAMLGGPVVFARDFGARNVKLRSRFPDRDWYVARLTRANGATQVTLEPYR